MNFDKMVRGMAKLKEISENLLGNQLNTERYVKELTDVVREMFLASGSMFQQEHLRFINMFAAAGSGGKGGGYKYGKTIMEHKIIQYFRAVNGEKPLFRQWHQNFTSALGQVTGMHEEIVQPMVKGIDLGK